MNSRDPDIAAIGPPVIDRVALDRLAAATGPLTAEECLQRAHDAGELVDASNIDRTGPGDAVLLWRNESSEADRAFIEWSTTRGQSPSMSTHHPCARSGITS
jgi:hypothetical protein